MFGWLRRKHTDRPDSTGWSDDAVPTPHERRDELLSAYLDDDLDASERAELDARLASDPDLGEALEGMRTVRDTLASLEVVRAPRSFAITTPAAPARRGFRPIDLAARAGTMVAVVAFVVVLAGDLSGGDGTPIVQERTSESLSTEAADSAGGGAADEAAESTGDNNGGAAGSQPAPAPGADDADADDADAEAVTASGPASDGADDAATPEAPVLDSDATVQAAAAATAERSATEEASGTRRRRTAAVGRQRPGERRCQHGWGGRSGWRGERRPAATAPELGRRARATGRRHAGRDRGGRGTVRRPVERTPGSAAGRRRG